MNLRLESEDGVIGNTFINTGQGRIGDDKQKARTTLPKVVECTPFICQDVEQVSPILLVHTYHLYSRVLLNFQVTQHSSFRLDYAI